MKVIFLQVFLLLVFSINAQTLQWANQRQVYHETKIHLDDDGNVFMIGEFIGTVDFDHSTSTFMMTATSQYGSVFLLKQSPDGDFLWAKQIESVSGNVTWSQGYNINTDNDGNVYITGRFGGTVDFDMGSNVSTLTAVDDADAFLAKYDNDGNYQWVINVGGIDYEYGKDIVFSESESALYLTGTFKTTVDFDPGPGIDYLTSNGLNEKYKAI